jgi:hypothetical protein
VTDVAKAYLSDNSLWTNFHHDNLKASKPNSVGLINCLRQPGQFRKQPQKSMRVNLNPFINSCGTWTNPAAETKSMGLSADALVPCFLLAI